MPACTRRRHDVTDPSSSSVETPPLLCRTSALTCVRVAARGRRMAQKLLLDTDSTYLYYFGTVDGDTMHYLAPVDLAHDRRRWCLRSHMLPALDVVPR